MELLQGFIDSKAGACIRYDAQQGGCQASVQSEGTFILQDLGKYLWDKTVINCLSLFNNLEIPSNKEEYMSHLQHNDWYVNTIIVRQH